MSYTAGKSQYMRYVIISHKWSAAFHLILKSCLIETYILHHSSGCHIRVLHLMLSIVYWCISWALFIRWTSINLSTWKKHILPLKYIYVFPTASFLGHFINRAAFYKRDVTFAIHDFEVMNWSFVFFVYNFMSVCLNTHVLTLGTCTLQTIYKRNDIQDSLGDQGKEIDLYI